MPTLNLQVAASADDAYQFEGGTADITATSATIGTGTAATSPDRAVAFRFTNVTIPPGSTITSAVPKPMMSSARWGQTNGTWFGNDTDNAAAFTNGEVLTSRPLTAANVPFSENINRASATRYAWPASGDWSAIIQEIIDRPGWASGNAIALIVIGDSGSSFASDPIQSYDNSPSDACTLDIDYTEPLAHASPTSDVSNAGSWTTDSGGTTNLYQSIDETSFSDSDYVRSPVSPSSAVLEVGLGSITDPASSASHEIRFRARQDAAGPAYGLTVALYQGATQKASYSPAALTASFADYSYALTGTEADSITDYGDLRLRITATETLAAPTYVASGAMVNTATSGATMAPQAPASRQAGDLLVLVAHTSSNGDFSDTITNWTKLASGTETNTTAQKVECWWRVADGTSADNATVGGIANTSVRTARIFAVRGAANQAPTVARSNNAASATVTFPAATASAATTLSVLAYCYEDDPTAIGTVSGFSAFDVDTTATGSDAATGTDASRTNSSSGSKAGGTATVSGGTFANSVNVGLHFIFEPVTGTRAQVSWAEFVAPLATGPSTFTLSGSGTAPVPTGSGTGLAVTNPTYTLSGSGTGPDPTGSGIGLTTVQTFVLSGSGTAPVPSGSGAGLTFTAPSGPVEIANDTFSGGVGLLSTHTSDSGDTWTENPFSSDDIDIESDGSASCSTEGIFTIDVDPTTADYEAELDIRFESLGSGYAGILLRCNPSGTPWYYVHYDGATNEWRINKQGVGTALNAYSQVITTSQVYRLRAKIYGSSTTTIELYVDGVLRTTADDTSSPITAINRAGVATSGGSVFIDNFSLLEEGAGVETFTLSGSGTAPVPSGSGTGLTFSEGAETSTLSGSGTAPAPTGPPIGITISNPSFAIQDFAQAENLGPDGYTWAQGYPLTVDQYDKIVSIVQRTSGNGHYWVWSNDGGANWTNSAEGDKISFMIRGSVAYDHINDRFHVAWVDSNRENVIYRRYAPTRDGSNNITAIQQVTSVSVVLASGPTYEHPVMLFLSDAVYGSNGAVVVGYGVSNGTTGRVRLTMRVLSNTTADATDSNWEAPNGTNDSALAAEALYAASTSVASKANGSSPGIAIARWRGVSRAGDLAVFYSYYNDNAYHRRLPYNTGTGRWGTLTSEQTVADLVGAGGSPQQEEQLLSKPSEDVAGGRMFIGLARWKDATAGETWSFRSVNSSDVLGNLIDVYSAGGVFDPADYALTGDIVVDEDSGMLISAHILTGQGNNDAVLTTYDNETQVQQTTVFTAADVDIPLIWQDSRTGAIRYGSSPDRLLMVFRDTDGYPSTAPPYRGWFGTVEISASFDQGLEFFIPDRTLSGSGTAPVPTGSGTGLTFTKPTYTLSGSGTAPTPSGSGTGLIFTKPTYTLSGSGTAPAPTGTGAGLTFTKPTYTLSGSSTASTPTGTGTGLTFTKPTYTLSGSGTAPVPSGSGAGLTYATAQFTFSGSGTAPSPTGTGIGLTFTKPVYTLSGSGTTPTPTGDGAGLTFTKPTYTISGSGTAVVPSGSGAGLTFGLGIFTLSGVGIADAPTGAGAGLTFTKPVRTLLGAGVTPTPTGSGTGITVSVPIYTLSGSGTIPNPTGTGLGLHNQPPIVTLFGSGQLPNPTGSGAGLTFTDTTIGQTGFSPPSSRVPTLQRGRIPELEDKPVPGTRRGSPIKLGG